MFNRLRSVARTVRKYGLINVLRGRWSRMLEAMQDRRLGIDTAGNVSCQSLGLQDTDRNYYCPTEFGNFHMLMRASGVDYSQGAFLDFGSGKGRALILAATYPFKRIIGVEISNDLQTIARSNLEKARPRLACQNIDLITADATTFDIPDNVIAIFFNNPFYGTILSAVLERIAQSLARSPREVVFLCDMPSEGAKFLQQLQQCDWLTKRMGMALKHDRYGAIFSAASDG